MKCYYLKFHIILKIFYLIKHLKIKSYFLRAESVSHLPLQKRSWKNIGTKSRWGCWEGSIDGENCPVVATQGSVWPANVSLGTWCLALISATLKTTSMHRAWVGLALGPIPGASGTDAAHPGQLDSSSLGLGNSQWA